ncbi:helix-turn-helix domain-containing protein [Pseudomonas fluorescens]|uniref:helix-turn-helix domain-containing protein n=1 Tax=Pseudomonas fluorescens TaxID=294 RepID=UPI0021D3DA6D|nr:helix-turn-helix domain-containing protein [Pseudomonas fluorescens]UXV19269.1 helix-turn-helix domain-containing protein [Pseudomonas fluorescens]
MSEVETGSGNVYADIGDPEAEEMLAKAQTVSSIIRLIEEKGLSLGDAARLVGVPQVQLSKLLIGRFQANSLIELEEMRKKIGDYKKYDDRIYRAT